MNLSRSMAEWEMAERDRWKARYGDPERTLPQKQDDGSYSTGIGHTGEAWPRGRGHDYCWAPFDCISCGCTPSGPCDSHRNEAWINGWRP